MLEAIMPGDIKDSCLAWVGFPRLLVDLKYGVYDIELDQPIPESRAGMGAPFARIRVYVGRNCMESSSYFSTASKPVATDPISERPSTRAGYVG